MPVGLLLAASSTPSRDTQSSRAVIAAGRTESSAADSDHLVGVLVVCVSVIAMAEVARIARFVNILFGAWLVASPVVVDSGNTLSTAVDVLAGVALIAIALAFRRGPVRSGNANGSAIAVSREAGQR